MDDTRDHVSVRIDTILLGLPPMLSQPSIFRVRNDVRSLNAKLYEPQILSIGPFYHGRNNLKKMEQHKFWYLQLLLKRMNKPNADKYVKALRLLEKEARECYAEPVKLNTDDFVQMLLLDGCFIIELIRKYCIPQLMVNDDAIFRHEQVLSQLRQDLVLVENQIPFFILNELFKMTTKGGCLCPNDDIQYQIQNFIFGHSPPPGFPKVTGKLPPKDIDHLLGLVYKILCSSFPSSCNSLEIKKMLTTIDYSVGTNENPIDTQKILAMNCATELQMAGVKFKKEPQDNFLDIQFIHGVLKIPCFYVSDRTESILRNLMVYEQCFTNEKPKYVTDYTFFMQCLINSKKDAQILRCCGIITNFLGDDKMVNNMFNRLGKNTRSTTHFCYGDVFDKVNEHCSHRRNSWKAYIKNNHCQNPLTIIALCASVVLLLLTFIQTLFSILSYTDPV